jgi:hypothetical protein
MSSEEVVEAASDTTGLDIFFTWAGFGANVAAVITAFVAVSVWLWFRGQKRKRRIRLEEYLLHVKEAGDDQGQRTIIHLMANLRMTEAQVFEAAFDSKKVITSPSQDHMGIAKRIFFQYTTGNEGEDLAIVTGKRRRAAHGVRGYAR